MVNFLLFSLCKILFFLFLAEWYFAYETMIRQPEGMDGYSVHQEMWLCYLTNFIIEITPPCRHFKMPFWFPESNTTNILVFLKCKIIVFLLLADLYLCHKTLHRINETMVRWTHQQAIAYHFHIIFFIILWDRAGISLRSLRQFSQYWNTAK